MNDIDIQMHEAHDRAAALETLPCGCVYDNDYGETAVAERCPERHIREARYVGGIVGYVIDGRPTT